MHRYKLILISLCLIFSTGLAAQQQEEEVLKASELLDACENPATANFCNTFIVTLVQTVTAMQESGQGPELFCINPQQISLDEVRRTIVEQLQKMPDRQSEEAYTLVSEILHQRYPCGGDSF